MNYDKDSFMAGLAVGRMLWRPPQTLAGLGISGIEIVTPPDKLIYSDGDTIDFTGLTVRLLDLNGDPYVDKYYPTGFVPFEELSFPITTAVYNGDPDSQYYTDGLGIVAIRIDKTTYAYDWRPGEPVYVYPHPLGYGEYSPGVTYPATLGGIGPGVDLVTRYFVPGYHYYNFAYNLSGSRMVDMKRIMPDGTYGGWGGTAARSGEGAFDTISWEDEIYMLPVSTVDPRHADVSQLSQCCTQSIPVVWTPPSGRYPWLRPKTASFDINVGP